MKATSSRAASRCIKGLPPRTRLFVCVTLLRSAAELAFCCLVFFISMASVSQAAIVRTQIQITGIVQGVGFRPFVFNLAQRLGLRGYVLNSSSGLFIEV